jgi:transcriptional regulator with XRE-family HTH domain
MPYSPEDHTGSRVADYRKLRHLTQEGLAQRAFVSRGMIAKVEAGLVPASPSFVAAVGRALGVDASVLYGQPYISEMRKDQIDQLISPLSEALDLYDIEPDPDITPRPTEALTAAAEQLIRRFRHTDYADVGRKLPGLLGELTTALHTAQGADERRQSARALANTYWIAHQFAARLGFPDLASVALDRMGWVAAQADDPLLQAVRLYTRSLAYVRRGTPDVGLKLVAPAPSVSSPTAVTGSRWPRACRTAPSTPRCTPSAASWTGCAACRKPARRPDGLGSVSSPAHRKDFPPPLLGDHLGEYGVGEQHHGGYVVLMQRAP